MKFIDVTPAPGAATLSQADTLEYLLGRTRSTTDAVLLRRALVQRLTKPGLGKNSPQVPGKLSVLMRSPHALDLLLLVHAVATGTPFDVTERSETWARATGMVMKPGPRASEAVSRQWRILAEHKLIATTREGRFTCVTKLREDGSGRAYTRPSGKPDAPLDELYFKLPYAYWREGWHGRLGMPGKAMLLIGMSARRQRFPLAQTRQFAAWYGLSPNTVSRGVEQLIEAGVLTTTISAQFATGATNTGRGVRTLYSFSPPFNLNDRAVPPPANAEDVWEFPFTSEPASTP